MQTLRFKPRCSLNPIYLVPNLLLILCTILFILVALFPISSYLRINIKTFLVLESVKVCIYICNSTATDERTLREFTSNGVNYNIWLCTLYRVAAPLNGRSPPRLRLNFAESSNDL